MPLLQGFIGGAYMSRSVNFDAQRCVNLYLEKSESGTSKDVAMLIGTPGLKLWKNFTGSTVRGMINFNDSVSFIVVGRFVYSVDNNDVVTSVGEIVGSTTPVSMASNGIVVFLACGSNAYVINPGTNTLASYTDVSFFGADKVDFIDGSFVFNQPGTGKFWAMDPYSTVLDPLYFATAEGSPDPLVSLLVNHREIWLFGATTIEVWFNNGDTTNFPYSRVQGAFLEQGCAATHSVAKIDGKTIWLSRNDRGQGMVYMAQGYTPVRISNHALEKEFAEYIAVDDAVAYTYQQEGHGFYVISFPSANRTWVYDTSTGLWHERLYRQGDGLFGRHRSNCHMHFNRRHYVGDWESGKVYELDPDFYTDDGNSIVRVRSSPHVTVGLERIAHNSIQFDMETGVGLQEGQGSDPKVRLRWSDDGGHQWSSQRECSLGRVGKYKTRARFTRLGQSRDRVYELSISDPVKVIIMGAIINGQ